MGSRFALWVVPRETPNADSRCIEVIADVQATGRAVWSELEVYVPTGLFLVRYERLED